MNVDKLEELKTHLVNEDLDVAEAMVKAPQKRYHGQSQDPIFWPDDYFDGKSDYTLEKYSLKDSQMKKYGKILTKLRGRLVDLAHKTAKEDAQLPIQPNSKYLDKLLKRMHKGYIRTSPSVDVATIKSDTPVMHRRKGRRRPMLTTGEKLSIIYAAIVDQLPWKAVAKEHRISISTLSALVRKSKKN